MAWRIEGSVVKGEIDNRIRGTVTGTIWFAGQKKPMTLRLSGNAWRDVAGRKLEFVNPEPFASDRVGLVDAQIGVVGDITASRRVKVPDVSAGNLAAYEAGQRPLPWRWTNSLYLEWFSANNGRIVVESADYQLRFVGEPAWEMTPEEETKQHQANLATISTFVDRLSDPAYAVQSTTVDDPNETFEVHEEGDLPIAKTKPLTEPEAEKLQSDAERLFDRIQARLRRMPKNAPTDGVISEEIDRFRRDRAPTSKPLNKLQESKWTQEMLRAGARAVGKPDPDASFATEHELAKRAQDFAAALMRETRDFGWRPPGAGEEHPVVELVNTVLKAGARLAGALNRADWPPPADACGQVIVRLNRARVYLDDAARAVEACQEQGLARPNWLGPTRMAIDMLANDTDLIIANLRSQLLGEIE